MTSRERSAGWLGMLLAIAAGIHVAVIGEHFRESVVVGTFFVVLSLWQGFLAVRTLTPASRRMLDIVVVSNAAVIGLWIVSRTVGLPISPEPWVREPVGIADVVSTGIELAIVVLALRQARTFARSKPSRQTRTRLLAGAAAAATIAAVFTTVLPAGAHSHEGLPGHVHGAHVLPAGSTHDATSHLHGLRRPGEEDPGPVRRPGAPLDSTNIAVGHGPGAVAALGESIWTANRLAGTLTRVDIATSVTRTFNVGPSPSGLAVLNNQLWVTLFGNDTVVRVDGNGRRIGSPISVGTGPIGIAASRTGIWILSSTNGTVERIDPVTNKTEKAIPTGFGPIGIAADGNDLWVTNSLDHTVVHVDAIKRRAAGAPIPVGGGPSGVAMDRSFVWIASATAGTLTKIERATDRVLSVIKVDDRTLPGQGPTSVSIGCGGVWVANNHDKDIVGVNAITGSIRSPLFYAKTNGYYPTPAQVVCSGGSLWVSNYDADTLSRITPA